MQRLFIYSLSNISVVIISKNSAAQENMFRGVQFCKFSLYKKRLH